MTPYFSMIIPVYNVEQFLEKCLNSVLEQTYKSWEVICVDDGSTDGSAGILKEFSFRDKNIRTKTIKNRGTAAARNEGIKLAKGNYLLFIDSDDWIKKDALQTVYDTLQKNEVDLLSFNGFIYHEATGDADPVASW